MFSRIICVAIAVAFGDLSEVCAQASRHLKDDPRLMTPMFFKYKAVQEDLQLSPDQLSEANAFIASYKKSLGEAMQSKGAKHKEMSE